MRTGLSYDLHALTARLDRAADRILRTEYDISYRRFLVLFIVGQLGPATQRALAGHLGLTEPSVSRMTGVLVQAGLLDAGADPAGGNRRGLNLTPAGKDMVKRCHELLERRFADLMQRSGVPDADYARHTSALLATLDSAEKQPRQ